MDGKTGQPVPGSRRGGLALMRSLKNKTKLALALKSYWEKHGKWKKKKCTRKQWDKVQKVQRILME